MPAYVDLPYGVFSFLNHEAQRLVFIAGGIGITPFLSMLRYMQDRELHKEVILLQGKAGEIRGGFYTRALLSLERLRRKILQGYF